MKNKTRIINLANINDINAYNFGEYVSTGNRWVNFGEDNDYPIFLRDLYLTSPTHQAVIDGVTNLATGEGVSVVEPEKNPISNKWLNENFPKDVVKKLISDIKLYGYCAIEVYNGSIVKYCEAIKFRFDTDNKNYVWFSNDWGSHMSRKNRPVKLPIYKEGSDEELSVLIIQIDKKGFDYYSPVDYNGGVNYITLESEISKYHLSNIKNGLFPSFVVNFIGTDYSDEQQAMIENQINKKFSGSANTGRAIIGFSATKDEATTLETVDQPSLPDTYQFLTKECSSKILVSHSITSPLMFGIREEGGGFGNNSEELEKSFYLFYESKLKHYQNYILELINKIMRGNMLYAEVKFNTLNPFKTNENSEKLSKNKTNNEINSQIIINKIDSLKVKPTGILIDENLFDELNTEKLYKYVKASKNDNLINKKLEILTKKGFVFKSDPMIIKNTKDYYFVELTYIDKK